MLALDDLPLELLEHILRIADSPEVSGQNQGKVYCHTALVARRWRNLSQRLLWEEVVLTNDLQAELFASSAGTKRFGTKSLRFLVPPKTWLSPDAAISAIESARCLRSLDLNGLYTTDVIDASLWENPALCGQFKL